MSTLEQAAPAATVTPRIPAGLWLLIGVGAALVGLLPWVVTGMRLPLQNLWATRTVPEQMPVGLLPFSQYAVVSVAALLLVGAGAAGLLWRALVRRRARFGFLLMLLGLLLGQLVAVVQTAVVLHRGLQSNRIALAYLAALMVGSLGSVLVGALAASLIAKAPRGGALVGLTVAALAVSPWVSFLLVPLGGLASELSYHLLGLTPWLVPVLVGVAIAWAGLRTAGRVVGALVSLALLWVVPAMMTAIVNATGSRNLLRDPTELVSYGTQVFFAALTSPALALRPLVVAAAVAAVGLVGRRVVGRSRRPTPASDEHLEDVRR